MVPDRIQLRDFILKHYSRDELGLLCTDYFPDFYRDYAGTNTPLTQLVNELIEHCERRDWLENLCVAAHAKRQEPYEKAFGRPHIAEVKARPRNPKQVFISYAYEDATFARRLAQDLRVVGLTVWMAPDSIQPGELWAKAIDRGLRESGLFVVVLTPAAAASRWVEHEMFVAIGYERDRQMQFFPLLAQACDPGELPALLQPYQFLSFERDYVSGLAQLSPRLGVVVQASLPKDLADALDDPRPFVRRGAVEELAQLLKSANASLAGTAHAALQRLALEDDSLSVRAAAQAVLNATQQPDPARLVETLRQTLPTKPTDPPTPGPASDDIILSDLDFRLELVRIPAGPFTMGGDGAYDGKPIHKVTLPQYFIGKYPVTNAQYATFAKATKRKFDLSKGKENHPVVNVTWHDALAFCEWLSTASKRKVVLPSEAEWEKAARGPSTGSGDEHPYPWGDAEPDGTLCNFNNNEKGSTPVGKYSPRGDSPYGCADMVGNVWEWTCSKLRDYPYHSDDGRESLADDEVCVVRGGSWNYHGGSVRAAYRLRFANFPRRDNSGFRVGCVSAPVP